MATLKTSLVRTKRGTAVKVQAPPQAAPAANITTAHPTRTIAAIVRDCSTKAKARYAVSPQVLRDVTECGAQASAAERSKFRAELAAMCILATKGFEHWQTITSETGRVIDPIRRATLCHYGRYLTGMRPQDESLAAMYRPGATDAQIDAAYAKARPYLTLMTDAVQFLTERVLPLGIKIGDMAIPVQSLQLASRLPKTRKLTDDDIRALIDDAASMNWPKFRAKHAPHLPPTGGAAKGKAASTGESETERGNTRRALTDAGVCKHIAKASAASLDKFQAAIDARRAVLA